MPYEFGTFGFNQMMDCRSRIRDLLSDDPPTMEEAAQRAVHFFRDEFRDEHGQEATALVRFFKTHPYEGLPPGLQAGVQTAALEAAALAGLRCLTLVATEGDRPEWCSRHASVNHQVIPLISVEMVQQAPMIAQLITQMGVPITDVVRPPQAVLRQTEATSNVFYVPHALGSPHIVAQDEFVARYGIESVLGFGGMLASGDLFAMILFSKVPIPPSAADQFRVVGLNLKIAILPCARKPLFREDTDANTDTQTNPAP